MKSFQLKSTVDYKSKWEDYPTTAQKYLHELRKMIIETAENLKEVESLEETLRWGEVSYISKKGSTIRLDWKVKAPEHAALYFNCNTKLVATFRMVYPKIFTYEGSRVILLPLEEPIPTIELQKCIETAIRYHTVKHLTDLGIG